MCPTTLYVAVDDSRPFFSFQLKCESWANRFSSQQCLKGLLTVVLLGLLRIKVFWLGLSLKRILSGDATVPFSFLLPFSNGSQLLTLLHSERPKLYEILVCLSTIVLKKRIYSQWGKLFILREDLNQQSHSCKRTPKEQIISFKSKPKVPNLFNSTTKAGNSLRQDLFMEWLHFLGSKQEVTKVVPLCKNGAKT